MDVYKVEDQRIEDIKAWWRENGLSIVVSVALGVGAIFGWRAWQASTLEKAQAASQLHGKMATALRDEDNAGAKDAAAGILEQYDSTAYAVFARLTLAKLAVADGELEDAAAHLRWALEQNLDESFSPCGASATDPRVAQSGRAGRGGASCRRAGPGRVRHQLR